MDAMDDVATTMATDERSEDSARLTRCRLPHRFDGLVRDCYGYGRTSAPRTLRREVPSAGVPLIIGFDGAFRVFAGDSQTASPALASFIAGPHDRWVVTESSPGPIGGIQVNLTPIGARMFFGRPLDGLANRVVALEEALGATGAPFIDSLREACWSPRFAAVEALLDTRFAMASAPPHQVAYAWSALRRTRGRVTVGALAGEVGWSRKHLAVRFREELGMPPKTMARVLRFDHARRLIEQSGRVAWADLAVRCGYYDQSHLIRDFRQFSGAAPSALLVAAPPPRVPARTPPALVTSIQDRGW